MSFWIVPAAIIALIVLWIAWPLLRPRARDAAPAEHAVAVYHDQLRELARERERGLIGDVEAEAARAEIERRLLAAGRTAMRDDTPRARRHVRIAALLAVLVPVASLLLYLVLGSPELSDRSAAEQAEAPGAAQDGVVAEARMLLATAEARAEASPGDAQAWFDLGRLRLVTGETAGAVDALARARELAPDRPEIASAHGEALAQAADGLVTPAARRAFEAALAGDGGDPRARYFLALGDYQDGRVRAALDAWSVLAGEAPADAPWLATVRDRIRGAARELGRDPADWLPRAPGAARGPTEADIAAAAELSAEERRAMIQGMVDNLAARLESDPDDAEGWRMLGRSRETLGEPGKAAAAYARALELEPDDTGTLMRAAIAFARAGDAEAARGNFLRLLDLTPPGTDAHRMVSEALARLDEDAPAR